VRHSDEGKDHAAEWLSQETRKPGSGVTARTPRPSRESLYSFELENAGIPTSLPMGVWDSHDVDTEAETSLARLMDRLLGDLSPQQQQAIELVAVAGMSFGAAAKEMGVAKATVYSHYRDGLERLRKTIAQHPWAGAIIAPWLADDDHEHDGQESTGPSRPNRLPDLTRAPESPQS
jgi:DNA-directed RNA polymerase specialized sigma24 family protein